VFDLMKKRVLVFTPTYNELENIEFWLELVISQGDSDILVVDDSSRDGTTELLRVKARQVPRLKLIVRESKIGIGSAHQDALKFAVEKGYDLLITLDADLSHDPRDINRFINASEGVNYIVGTRSDGGRNELTGIRWMLSKGANLVCRVMIPTGLTEYTTSYRCYDRQAMLFLASNPPKGEGYSYFIETTDMLYRGGLKLAEIPIVFRDRLHGKSKIPNLQAFKSCIVILKLTFIRVTRKRSKSYQNKL
jgi:dolichol-phosphate mannosyltransferase